MITLNSISYTYPGESEAALRDVSLTLGDATVTALVGPNGSGKTTLMQILGGLMVPTSGSISIDGTQASADDLLTGSIMASSSRDLDDVPATILVQYARLRPTWDEALFAHYVESFSLPVQRRKTLGKLSTGQAAVFAGAIALHRARPSPSSTRSKRPWTCPPDTPSTRRSSPWRRRSWRESARSAASSSPRTWSLNSRRSPKTSSS